ncbi:MAG TPA: SH3-like domain-containing protein [Streptosporangiaceae bacterium]|nr:SH3-like domain-containing protein [Streptosporangiaceae bacterium]
MSELFAPGDQVCARRVDPPHHTRLPRYLRGAVGTIVEVEGRYPLPDNRARQLPAGPEPVYAVRFAASDLFGTGEHTITAALWESYLRPAAGARASEARVNEEDGAR